jgi:hypothetical protein
VFTQGGRGRRAKEVAKVGEREEKDDESSEEGVHFGPHDQRSLCMGPLKKSQRDAGRPHNAAWNHKSIANISPASSSALAAFSSSALAFFFFLGVSDARCESFNFKAKESWVLFIIVVVVRDVNTMCRRHQKLMQF